MALIVPDSSVLIAALDARDAHHDRAVEVLETAWDERERVVIPVIAYAEIMVRPLALGGAVLERVEAFFATQELAHLDAVTARSAACLRADAPWLRTPDALIIATAVGVGADRVVTADARWSGLAIRPAVEVIALD